jgi:hypothetical protein
VRAVDTKRRGRVAARVTAPGARLPNRPGTKCCMHELQRRGANGRKGPPGPAATGSGHWLNESMTLFKFPLKLTLKLQVAGTAQRAVDWQACCQLWTHCTGFGSFETFAALDVSFASAVGMTSIGASAIAVANTRCQCSSLQYSRAL